MAYENIISETRDAVGIITLNRPKALNALNEQLIDELNQALSNFQEDAAIGCVIIAGSDKAFAAGADIREMKDKSFTDVYLGNFLSAWDRVAEFRKPVIAAVSGYCLGGGCELALMCDFIIASDTARFGQPEITLGVMPGAGGTQRLARFIGKAKAMDMILTGRLMESAEAERCGLVSRIVAPEKLLDEAVATAAKIAAFSQPVVMMAKEAVNRAFETSLAEGLRFERRLMHSLFALDDQKEGMAAFVEKRKPVFKNR
ncbi:MAG: enoyl-CoA hydratase [Aestuariivirga sp.]|nr:enoyl-CoA hydratase [Aestuariivirga sp.]